MLNQKYRVFISQPFTHHSIETFFIDWKVKDMVGWHKVTNYNSKAVIEFYGLGNPYNIKINTYSYTIPYPITLDDFVSDCKRCGVELEWDQSIYEQMNRIYFLEQKGIENYNTKLLTTIEKL